MFSFSSLPLVVCRLCFSAIGWFFQCTHHSRLPEQFSGSKAASCVHFQGQHCRCLWGGLLKEFSEIVRYYRIRQNFDFDVKPTSLIIFKNHQRIYRSTSLVTLSLSVKCDMYCTLMNFWLISEFQCHFRDFLLSFLTTTPNISYFASFFSLPLILFSCTPSILLSSFQLLWASGRTWGKLKENVQLVKVVNYLKISYIYV